MMAFGNNVLLGNSNNDDVYVDYDSNEGLMSLRSKMDWIRRNVPIRQTDTRCKNLNEVILLYPKVRENQF